MKFETLLFDVKDHVAHLTLNRPESANTVNLEFSRDLMHAVLHCDENPDIRAVLLSGAGKMFCGGGDLKQFAAKGADLPYHLKETTTYLHAAVSRMARMDPPVVCAVHGAAAGAGLSLALCSDIVIAAESAKFTAAYTRVGLCPDGSLSYFLPRKVGLQRALELVLTNRTLTAEEASAYGIVTRVVAEAELPAQAKALAGQLAQGPTKAFGEAKRLLLRGFAETLETQMENESQGLANMARTADVREGVTAFLEKREAKFEGK